MSKGPLRLVPHPVFRGPVEIPTPEGVVTVQFLFRHRKRSELPAFFEKLKSMDEVEMIKSMAADPATTDQPIWDAALGDFTDENITQFLDNYHQAAFTFTQSYVQLLTQFKKGN